eukprot:SAG31_NODE_1129_length_9755_cov_2.095070_13_plen_92_part_00
MHGKTFCWYGFQAVRQATNVHDVATVDAVLQKYKPAQEFLGPVLAELTAHRHNLVSATAENLQAFLLADPSPVCVQSATACTRSPVLPVHR